MESKNKVKMIVLAIILLAIASITGWYMLSNGPLKKEITIESKEYLCVTHENLAQHKHVQMNIISNGEAIYIPANIGVDTNCTSEVHTHDDSGKIHIESYKKDKWFSVSDFYNEWQREKNFDQIANESFRGVSTVYVNGKIHPRKGLYLFSDGDNITITYTKGGTNGTQN